MLQQKPDFYSLEVTAESIIKDSNNLIRTYEELAADEEAMKQNILDGTERLWKQDKDRVIDLLARGKDLSLSRVAGSLPTSRPSDSATSPADAAADSACDEISHWFRSKQNDELPETFRQTAKGLRRITRYLPAPTNVRSIDKHPAESKAPPEGGGVCKNDVPTKEDAPKSLHP